MNLKRYPGYEVFYPNRYVKRQIVLHHTASPSAVDLGRGDGVSGDIAHWKNTKMIEGYNLGTTVIVGSDGVVHSLFNPEYWAHHIGAKAQEFGKFGLPNINRTLNKQSLGLEIDSIGPLEPAGNGLFRTAIKSYQSSKYVGHLRFPSADVTYFPDKFRGYYYWHNYTDAQVASVVELLADWSRVYDIPITDPNAMFEISKAALRGDPGVYGHCNYRPDKSDIFPYPPLIAAIEALRNPPEIIVPPRTAPMPIVLTESGLEAKRAEEDLAKFIEASAGFTL